MAVKMPMCVCMYVGYVGFFMLHAFLLVGLVVVSVVAI